MEEVFFVKDLIIIGAGPAGMTAALYALRAGRSVLVLEAAMYGGQVAVTPEVENYPAIKHIDGPTFAMNLYSQITDLGATVQFEDVTGIADSGSAKTVITATGKSFECRALIIANGAKRRKLNIAGEAEFAGYGVSYCATCDGFFFKDKDVAVVGGGNTALEDVIYLSSICKTVHLIHRRDVFRGSQILVDQVLTLPNVTIHYDCVPTAIYGGDSGGHTVKSVALESTKKKDGSLQRLPISAVFVAIGTIPDNTRFLPFVTLDEAGYIVAGEDCKTETPGLYVAGDTRQKHLRQIVTATADGAVAATHAVQQLVAEPI